MEWSGPAHINQLKRFEKLFIVTQEKNIEKFVYFC